MHKKYKKPLKILKILYNLKVKNINKTQEKDTLNHKIMQMHLHLEKIDYLSL